MQNKKIHPPVTTIGVPLLLVVFIVLCLLTFACLSLSTAKSDYSYSKENAAHKAEYYEACNKTEEFVHDINLGNKVPITSQSVKINSKQALKVKIGLSEGKKNANAPNAYEIKAWQVVSTVKRNYNQNLTLIK